jgi:DNA-binding transcriptional ArsR family regulator
MLVANQALLEPEIALRVAKRFRALGDAVRVRIVHVLLPSDVNVGGVAQLTGLSESAVSHPPRRHC